MPCSVWVSRIERKDRAAPAIIQIGRYLPKLVCKFGIPQIIPFLIQIRRVGEERVGYAEAVRRLSFGKIQYTIKSRIVLVLFSPALKLIVGSYECLGGRLINDVPSGHSDLLSAQTCQLILQALPIGSHTSIMRTDLSVVVIDRVFHLLIVLANGLVIFIDGLPLLLLLLANDALEL